MSITFGQYMRGIRYKKGLTLRHAARKLTFSAAYISDIELGRRNPPSQKTILEWCGLIDANIINALALASKSRNRPCIDCPLKRELVSPNCQSMDGYSVAEKAQALEKWGRGEVKLLKTISEFLAPEGHGHPLDDEIQVSLTQARTLGLEEE